MNSTIELTRLVLEIGKFLVDQTRTVTTVESCTGGGIAQALTALPGSSKWFSSGFVTYSNEAKSTHVDVPMEMIAKYGAVSQEVAQAMAEGGLVRANADYALSVTGIAGPSGGSAKKPIGTVCFGWVDAFGNIDSETALYSGNRTDIRDQSISYSLIGLLNRFHQ